MRVKLVAVLALFLVAIAGCSGVVNATGDKKLVINIVHIAPEGKECPDLVYKSGVLVNPCLIAGHWKIIVKRKELSLEELKKLLVIEGDLDRETPGNSKTPSNRTVLIQPDDSAPYGSVVKVIEACAKAYLWKLEFGTDEIYIPLPKDEGMVEERVTSPILEEVRICLKPNPTSLLSPNIQIGRKEFKDWDSLYAVMKAIVSSYEGTVVPITIDPAPNVPFQTVINAIKIVRKSSDTIPIEFASHWNLDVESVYDYGSEEFDSEDFDSEDFGFSAKPLPIKKYSQIKTTNTPVNNTFFLGHFWLARHQNPDGSWGAKSFQNQCKSADNPAYRGKDVKCSGTGDEQFDIGLTGLALLAFTGAGYTNHFREKYQGVSFGEVVRKAAAFLIGIQKPDGSFGGVKDGKFIYNQALATYALSDLYALSLGTPASGIYKEPVERAVKFLLEAQNPGKGWRYQPKDGQSDTSVTGWVTMALKSAENAGIFIPSEAFAGVKSFLDSNTDSSYGKVGYTELGSIALMMHEDPRKTVVPPSMTAIGVSLRLLLDKEAKDPLIRLGVAQVLASPPRWDTSKPGIIDYYYWFYGLRCLYLSDGPESVNWKTWGEKAKDVLAKNLCLYDESCAAGSWDPLDRWSGEGGRVYATAINTLTLEVYYRLPLVRYDKNK